MARTFTATDSSVFRTEALMKTRNRQLSELEKARESHRAAVEELRKRFESEFVSWCSDYIVYTAEARENLYRIDVPGSAVSVFWMPGEKRIADLDWEGAHECTPWQMKRLLENMKEIRKKLIKEQNRRMQADADAIGRRLAALNKQTQEISHDHR